MTSITRILLALGAFFVAALGIAACGGGVPSNSVVRIDDALITRADFDHWLGIAAQSSQPPGSTAKVAVPRPPDFTTCVDDKIRSAPPVKGQPKPTRAAAKLQCKQEYESLRDQVLSFLISSKWLQGEAKDQGVSVTDAQANTNLDKQIKQKLPGKGAFARYLKQTGYTRADLILQVKTDMLTSKIRDKVTKDAGKVTDAQVVAYYKKNKARFAQPERRDISVVLTKTKAKAEQARSEITGGASFASVSKKLSIDQASKSQGGRLTGVTRGQQEKALDTAIFAAKKGKLTGPVKTQFGYYVFKVTNSTPASQQSLAQAKPTIRALLKSEGQQKALTKFVKKFESKWKSRTDCRKGFVVQTCKNAPKTKQQPQVPGGAVPQGQGTPQQVPPQQVPQGTPQPAPGSP